MRTLFLLVLFSLLLWCSLPAPVIGQTFNLCSLKSGTTVYNLTSRGTASSNGSISSFPTGYTTAYINFCQKPPQCGSASFACVTNSKNTSTISLCTTAAGPQGTFLLPDSPQVGASFGCSDNSANYQLNGIVGSSSIHP